MTNTTKYILVGAACLVGTVVVANRIAAARAAAAKPTGLAGAIAGASQIVDSFSHVSWGSSGGATRALAPGGIPYGPGVGDGYAAVSDATGVRRTNMYAPGNDLAYDPKLAGIAG